MYPLKCQEQKTHGPVPDPEKIRTPINHRQKALRATLPVTWWAESKEPSHFDQQEGREAKGPWGKALHYALRRGGNGTGCHIGSSQTRRRGPRRVEEEPGVFMLRESCTDSPETGQTAQVPGQASRHLGVNHGGPMGLCQAI